MEQKSTSVWKSAITYGLIIGIVLIVYSVILYAIGESFNQNLGYLAIVIMIAGIIWAQLSYKKLQGGYLTYGQGVGVAVASMLFAGILLAIFTYLLYTVIDPDLYNQYLLFYEEKVTSKMLEKGLSEAEISQAIEMTKRFQSPIIIAGGAFINCIFVGLIVGLITSIFTKKKPEEEVEVVE